MTIIWQVSYATLKLDPWKIWHRKENKKMSSFISRSCPGCLGCIPRCQNSFPGNISVNTRIPWNESRHLAQISHQEIKSGVSNKCCLNIELSIKVVCNIATLNIFFLQTNAITYTITINEYLLCKVIPGELHYFVIYISRKCDRGVDVNPSFLLGM